jgi:hypothetical protein
MNHRPFFTIVLTFLLFGFSFTPVFAQESIFLPIASPSTDATLSGDASLSAEVATVSAEPEVRPPERSTQNITEPTTETQDSLVEFLNQQPFSGLSWYNPLQYGIREAIKNGVSANIIVLILLFPVITAIISFSRHMVGLKGFGVYTPAVLSVAFVSTGIANGIFLFLITLAASTIMKKILRRLRLQYLPRTAMLLWGVSVFMLIVLISLSFFPFSSLLTIRIFPLLIIMLLTENFLESQLTGSQSEAQQLTIETLIIAILCSVLIGLLPVQQFVLLWPELTLLVVAGINMVVGRYTGLRILEWLRFRTIINT